MRFAAKALKPAALLVRLVDLRGGITALNRDNPGLCFGSKVENPRDRLDIDSSVNLFIEWVSQAVRLGERGARAYLGRSVAAKRPRSDEEWRWRNGISQQVAGGRRHI